MANILIIKHGSLGDLIQANGAMEDIKKSDGMGSGSQFVMYKGEQKEGEILYEDEKELLLVRKYTFKL